MVKCSDDVVELLRNLLQSPEFLAFPCIVFDRADAFLAFALALRFKVPYRGTGGAFRAVFWAAGSPLGAWRGIG